MTWEGEGVSQRPFLLEKIMDIKAIEDNIKELENSITNVDNVQELACLYIVRDNLLKQDTNIVEQELNDILPAYKKFCITKTKYQMQEVTEDAVVHDMKIVCQELKEFILSLYSNSDFYKERQPLIKMLDSLHLE